MNGSVMTHLVSRKRARERYIRDAQMELCDVKICSRRGLM